MAHVTGRSLLILGWQMSKPRAVYSKYIREWGKKTEQQILPKLERENRGNQAIYFQWALQETTLQQGESHGR
jgi:hypothetical protein